MSDHYGLTKFLLNVCHLPAIGMQLLGHHHHQSKCWPHRISETYRNHCLGSNEAPFNWFSLSTTYLLTKRICFDPKICLYFRLPNSNAWDSRRLCAQIAILDAFDRFFNQLIFVCEHSPGYDNLHLRAKNSSPNINQWHYSASPAYILCKEVSTISHYTLQSVVASSQPNIVLVEDRTTKHFVVSYRLFTRFSYRI